MIVERYKAGSALLNQKMLFMTVLFNKIYFWMEDTDGTVYLVKGKPRQAVSVNGTTGEAEIFNEDWVPDFT